MAAAIDCGSPCNPCTATEKQLAVVQGENDGLICKISGYERALQDAEMELAERDLQVLLLKSFIKDLQNPSDLQASLRETPEHNCYLQQEVQRLTLSRQAVPTAEPAPVHLQVSLLRAALAEANYRLAAAGMSPVTATAGAAGFNEVMDISKQSSTACSKRSTSRLFTSRYSSHNTSAATHSTTTTPPADPKAGSRGSPCAPALCLLSKLSGVSPGTALDGPDTPAGFDSKPATSRLPSTDTAAASHCPTPMASPTAAVLAALPVCYEQGVATAQTAGVLLAAGRSSSGFLYVEPYRDDAADLSESEDESSHSCQLSDTDQADSTTATSKAAAGLTVTYDKSSLQEAQAVCRSSVDTLTTLSSLRKPKHSGPPTPPGMHYLPGLTCSCNNPLFAVEEDAISDQ